MTEESEDDLMEAHSTGYGQAVNVRLIGYDKPFLTAVAIALSIFSILFSFYLTGYLIRTEYWLQRNEAFLEQLSTQGVHVPPDLLHKEH